MGSKTFKLVAAMATLAMPILTLVAPAQATPASDLLSLVNTLRATVSAAPLAVDTTMSSAAQQWASHMATSGVLAHNPNEAAQVPPGWTKMGENIGSGPSISVIYNIFVGSPAHHANMVDPVYNRTGIGVAADSHGVLWVVQDFGAYPPPGSAVFVFPTTGDLIIPAPQPFSWQEVSGATYYCLTVGSSRGGHDLVDSGILPNTQLSYTVPALPGSQPLWARIYSYVRGTWTRTDASFSVTGPNRAFFTRPTAGATNVATTKPFTWSPVASAGYYGMTVGTTQGGNDLVQSEVLPASQTSYAVPALPTGKVLWARILSYIAGSWLHYSDVSFTAAPR